MHCCLARSMQGSSLKSGNFTGATMLGVDLRNASMQGINLKGAQLGGTPGPGRRRRQVDTGGLVTALSGATLTTGNVLYVRFDYAAVDNVWFTYQVNCYIGSNTLLQLKQKLASVTGM
jgi:uncharacterized protein YjbI with pentapeptide repeats